MIEVSYTKRTRKRGILSQSQIEHIIVSVLKKERHTAGTISVHLVGTKRMQSLNTLYRGVSRPTDVLSFATGEQWGDETDFGDVFVCEPYIREQAKRFKVPVREEMARMLVHGVLHLLGYDHETETEAAQMFSRQEDYITTFVS